MLDRRAFSSLALLVALVSGSASHADVELEEVGAFTLPSITWDVAATGSGAITRSERGIETWDLSSPAAPRRVGMLELEPLVDLEVGHLAASGAVAYLADPSHGLRIFDVSNPEAPMQLANLPTPGEPQDVEIIGNHAYLADGTGGLRIVDVSNPAAPVESGSLALPTPGFAQIDVRFLEVASGRAYLTGTTRRIGSPTLEHALWIVDVSNPAAPAQLSVDDTLFCEPHPQDPAVASGVLYVADVADCETFPTPVVRVLDVSDPSAPVELTPLALGGVGATSIRISGGYAFFAGGFIDGFGVLDLATPTAPVQVASFGTGGPRLAVSGDIAVSTHGSGIEVVNIADPADPDPLAVVDPLTRMIGVRVVGTRAYVALAGPGLRILDVSDPSAPSELGYLELSPFPRPAPGSEPAASSAIEVVGDRAYLGGGYGGGVPIIDVSDPAAPVAIGSAPLFGLALDLGVIGERLFVNEHFDSPDPTGVHVFDVADPGSPNELDFFETATTPGFAPARMGVGEEFVHLIDDRFRVLELLPTDELTQRGELDLTSAGFCPPPLYYGHFGIGVAEPLVYTTLPGGCEGRFGPSYRYVVLDVSNPAQPSVRSSSPTSDGEFLFSGNELDAAGDYVYVIHPNVDPNESSRLQILRIIPVPEPAATLLALTALGVLSVLARSRRLERLRA